MALQVFDFICTEKMLKVSSLTCTRVVYRYIKKKKMGTNAPMRKRTPQTHTHTHTWPRTRSHTMTDRTLAHLTTTTQNLDSTPKPP
jgi:hypothetical protein